MASMGCGKSSQKKLNANFNVKAPEEHLRHVGVSGLRMTTPGCCKVTLYETGIKHHQHIE